MNHDRSLLRIVLISVLKLETLRQIVVHLYRTELPTAAYGILDHEIEFRTIERSLAILNLCLKPSFTACFNYSLFGRCPYLIGTDVLLMVVRIAQRYLCLHVVIGEVEC